MVSASIRRAENTGGQGPRTLTLISANLCANCNTRVSTNFVDSVFAPSTAFVFPCELIVQTVLLPSEGRAR